MKPLFASGSGFLIRFLDAFSRAGILVSMEPVDKAAIFESLCVEISFDARQGFPCLISRPSTTIRS
jgi:hypothetical protein